MHKNKIKKIIFWVWTLFTLIVPSTIVFAADPPQEIQLQVPIGTLTKVSDVGKYLETLFSFSISAVGIIAVVMIMVGGFMYVGAAGDAGKIGTAKTYITSAIVGMVILFTAYIMLNTINPATLKLGLPQVTQITAKAPTFSDGPKAFTYIINSTHGPTEKDVGLPWTNEVTKFRIKYKYYLTARSDLLNLIQKTTDSSGWFFPWPSTIGSKIVERKDFVNYTKELFQKYYPTDPIYVSLKSGVTGANEAAKVINDKLVKKLVEMENEAKNIATAIANEDLRIKNKKSLPTK